MEFQHAFWTEKREANHGFSQTLPVMVRFETVVNENVSALCYRIGVWFCEDPSASFTCTLNSAECTKFTKNPDQFSRIFHELVNNQSSIMDLINMDERLILSIRALGSELIKEMSWFSAILNPSSLAEKNQQMKLLISQLQSELSQERQITALLRQQNEQILARLKTMEDASTFIKQAVETLVQPLIVESKSSTSNSDDYPLSLPIVKEAKLKIQESLQPNGAFCQSGLGTSANVQLQDTRDDLLLGIASYLLCAVCEKVSVPAADSTELSRHFLNEHTDDAKRQCLACPDANVFDLLAHIKTHTHRIYACEFCGKKGRKHYLKSHVRTHTGEKPFKCQTCGRKFADQSTIRRHQTTVHSMEKKFMCPICQRDISRKDNYRVHLKSHSGATPIPNQAKINSSNLQKSGLKTPDETQSSINEKQLNSETNEESLMESTSGSNLEIE